MFRLTVRAMTAPGRSSRTSSSFIGCCCTLILRPDLRTPPDWRETSKVPNRTTELSLRGSMAHLGCAQKSSTRRPETSAIRICGALTH
jgi:hypothetical protein